MTNYFQGLVDIITYFAGKGIEFEALNDTYQLILICRNVDVKLGEQLMLELDFTKYSNICSAYIGGGTITIKFDLNTHRNVVCDELYK